MALQECKKFRKVNFIKSVGVFDEFKIFWLVFMSNFCYRIVVYLRKLLLFTEGRELSMLNKPFLRFYQIICRTENPEKNALWFQIWYSKSLNLCLNLVSRKWVKRNGRLVCSLMPTWSWILKISLSEGLMNFIRAF